MRRFGSAEQLRKTVGRKYLATGDPAYAREALTEPGGGP